MGGISSGGGWIFPHYGQYARKCFPLLEASVDKPKCFFEFWSLEVMVLGYRLSPIIAVMGGGGMGVDSSFLPHSGLLRKNILKLKAYICSFRRKEWESDSLLLGNMRTNFLFFNQTFGNMSKKVKNPTIFFKISSKNKNPRSGAALLRTFCTHGPMVI